MFDKIQEMRSLLAGIILLSSISVFGAYTPVEYKDKAYEPQIRSVLLVKSENHNDHNPVINLGSSTQLLLLFDELTGENDFFQYTFIHCNSRWEKSNLQQAEYLQGAFMAEINNYTYSNNTFQTYVHYELKFPTQTMRPKLAGNYILKIYRNYDQEDIVLTRRFMVLDNRVSLSGRVRGATRPEFRFTGQEVDFEVDFEEFNIPNPMLDITAVILQNQNWNSGKYDLKPRFISNNTLDYNYEGENVFLGTNEFRFFDIRTLRFFSNNVAKKYTDSMVNVVLKRDDFRSHLDYIYYFDYNGKRVFDNKDGNDDVTDGDYTLVHFTLQSPKELEAGNVYIYGELTNWQIQEDFRMDYYPSSGIYYKKVKLKQSYYNYHYVVVNKEGEIDYTVTEGNYRDTENDYHVYIYHKDQYLNYDALVGMMRLNTNKQNNNRD